MGQSASKGASSTGIPRAADKVARRVADAFPPQQPAAPAAPITTTANNSSGFLRGTGIGAEDIRDQRQETYLRNLYQLDDEAMAKGPPEMPADLLKFLQDVGPVRQTIDREFTAPRLLETQNEAELNKSESLRHANTRQRIKMPLIGEDNDHTTTRNTNFSRLSAQADATNDFGLSNTQLYRLLALKEAEADGGINTFYENVSQGMDGSQWTIDKQNEHKKLLQDARNAIVIPILRMDVTDGTIFGAFAKDVPGPEVKTIVEIPESKVKLVLKDIVDMEEKTGESATFKLEERRQQRKGVTN